MKYSDRAVATVLFALVAASPAPAQEDRWSQVDENPSRGIDWKQAPAPLREKFLAFHKSSGLCWDHDGPDWSVPSPKLSVWELKGGAKAVFQVCNVAGGARTVTYIVMIARSQDLSDARPARLVHHNSGDRKIVTTSVVTNASFDRKGGVLAENEPLDSRGDACQRRHEWKWNGREFALTTIREWRKCDDEWPGADKGRPMPLIWPKRGG